LLGTPTAKRRSVLHQTLEMAGRLVARTGAGALLLFLLLPLIALFATGSAGDFLSGISHPVVLPALRLSLTTTSISLLVIALFGTALAWMLARSSHRWSRWLELAVQLPVVMPPAVAGLALLLAFGRHGLLGAQLARAGVSVAFTTAAVVLAEIFVSAPFFLQAAIQAFRDVDQDLLHVARSLGASRARTFFRVALPLAGPGLWSGAVMSWARALGEFGATLMFAGNMPGRTQTLPLAIYAAMESDLRASQSLSLLLVLIALVLLVAVRTAGLQPGYLAPSRNR
jgi:molybdate transport system permease protein